jgi:hypothetical protein
VLLLALLPSHTVKSPVIVTLEALPQELSELKLGSVALGFSQDKQDRGKNLRSVFCPGERDWLGLVACFVLHSNPESKLQDVLGKWLKP